MVIRTIRETYRVRCICRGSKDICAYLCDREGSGEAERFLVMGTGNGKCSKEMLPYFMDLFHSGRILGFEECFVREGALWIAFRYFEGYPFSEKLKGKNSIEERIHMSRELAEQIFAQNLPVYLQYEALHPLNLVVSEGRGVRANFLLFEPERMQDALFPMVQKRLAGYYRVLFAEELKKEALHELTEFVEKLEKAHFAEEIVLYRAFRRLDEELKRAQEEGRFEQKGYLTGVWKKVFRCAKDIFQFWYWVLIGGLLGFLVFVCVMPETAPKERNLFQSIGTLELIHYEPPLLPGTEETEEAEETKGNAETETQRRETTENDERGTESPKEWEIERTEEKSEAEMG